MFGDVKERRQYKSGMVKREETYKAFARDDDGQNIDIDIDIKFIKDVKWGSRGRPFFVQIAICILLSTKDTDIK